MLYSKKNRWGVYVTVSLLQLLFIPAHGGVEWVLKLSTFKSYDICWRLPL